MGLFDKKYCDICGEKISLLGNRKLENGNMCSSCAKLISPFMTDRRKTSVEEMKEHLAYREENKLKVSQFCATESYAEEKKIYIDRQKGNFLVSYHNPSGWEKENPDVIALSEVTLCNLDIRENREEKFREDADGNSVSYNPPRFSYCYDFYITVTLSSKWFNEIEIKLNSSDVEGINSQRYHNYEMMAREIIGALTGKKQSNISQGSGYSANDIIGGTLGFAGAFINQVAQNANNQQQSYNANSNQVNSLYTDCKTPSYMNISPIQASIDSKNIVLKELQTTGKYGQDIYKCPNCNDFVPSKFCPECGTKTITYITVRCSACSNPIEINGVLGKFCPECGKMLDYNDIVIN